MNGSRHQARERALTLLYEAELKGVAPSVVLDGLPVPPDPYTTQLVGTVEARRDEIDGLIGRAAIGWEVGRMAAVDRNVLRLGLAELLGSPDVPTPVVLDEAVELATEYSTDDSGRFVNGVLATLATEVRGRDRTRDEGGGPTGAEGGGGGAEGTGSRRDREANGIVES